MSAQSVAQLDPDVTLVQFRSLVVLASRGPQRTADLAATLGIAPSTVTRMCDRLVRRGLVQRFRRVADRRATWIALTEPGQDLVGEVMRYRRKVIGRYGLVLTLALGISGLGVIGLSHAIRQLTAGCRGSFVGSLLIGVYGLGGLVVAIFPTDRIDSRTDVVSQSTTGWIHSLTSLVSYLCVIVGMFILTWTFAHQERWQSLVV
jgi:DNA-binding MarR family transcriptional regulator